MVLFLIFLGGKDEGQRNLFTVIQVRFINLVIIVTLKDPTRLRMLPFRFLFYSHRLCLWLTAHSAAAEPPTTHAHTAPWPMDHFEVKRLEGQLPLRWSSFFFFLLPPPLRWDWVAHPMLYGAWSGWAWAPCPWWILGTGGQRGSWFERGATLPSPILSSLSPSASLLPLHHTTPHAGP